MIRERTKKTAVMKAGRKRQKRLLDLMGKLEWDPSYDYKAERRAIEPFRRSSRAKSNDT
jgi:hypothetical protein